MPENLIVMRAVQVLLPLVLAPSLLVAQSRWFASLQGGYSVSTETPVSFPGGGAFASNAFIARQVTPSIAVGIEGGFYGVENATTTGTTNCPELPAVCEQTVRSEVDWTQVGVTARASTTSGSWRPYGALGLAVYFGSSDTETTFTPVGGEPGLPLDQSLKSTAFGGSVGGGVEWLPRPDNGPWSLGLSARLHALIGGDENGEFAGDYFVTVMAGVGYRW